ncbi:EamA family transporter [Paenibacillus sp. S-38]|uniref:EamA family transporter n=1 Tax=Paenibacillus sp. S-38 TaxID=3416710 RepID=UPI003CEEF130
MTGSYIALLANIVLLVTGQILFKYGMQKIGDMNLMLIVTSPFIMGGVALYGVATLSWLYVLLKLPLGKAYPIQSLSYVLGIIAAWAIFKESMSMIQGIGVGVILFGVYLISR